MPSQQCRLDASPVVSRRPLFGPWSTSRYACLRSTTNSSSKRLSNIFYFIEYTQLQLQSKAKGAKLPYTGMISGLSYTVRTTGFTSLYRGLAPTLIGSIPKAGIRFGLNAVIKDALRDEDGKLTPGKNFVAGLGAGVTEALLVVAPVETVKTKVIEMNMPFLQGFRHIVKNEGMGGVYQGVSCLFSVCETRF